VFLKLWQSVFDSVHHSELLVHEQSKTLCALKLTGLMSTCHGY
jgi:hypothetical protein